MIHGVHCTKNWLTLLGVPVVVCVPRSEQPRTGRWSGLLHKCIVERNQALIGWLYSTQSNHLTDCVEFR
jgi:hypothetical protein